MIAKQLKHINHGVISFSSLWGFCPSKTWKMKEVKSLLTGVALFLFTLPLHAQKVYVCQDTLCHVIEMHDDESILYQEEDERIAFGLNMVYDTNEVDSVTFDKPSQLKSMEVGWMGKPWNKVQRFVVPPLQELEMIESEFQVRSEDGFGTDNVNYVARFKSKTAAKKFVEKYKKAESAKKFTLRTLGKNRHVPAFFDMKNEEDDMKNVSYSRLDVNGLRRAKGPSFSVLSFSTDSCEVAISYDELFKNVALEDARRVLFYWQNYQVDSADPHEQLMPEKPVFDTESHTNDGVVYEVHSNEMDVTCKAWLIKNGNYDESLYLERDSSFLTLHPSLLYSGIRFVLEFGNYSIADSLYACWKEEMDESVSLKLNGNSISLRITFSEPLPLEKAMVPIIRFDLEWHRPPLWDVALYESDNDNTETYESENDNTETIINDVHTDAPLWILDNTVNAFVHDHSDVIEDNTVSSFRSVSWAMNNYLTNEEKNELKRLGEEIFSISWGDTTYGYRFNEKLPPEIAESLWNRMRADKEIQATVESTTFDLLYKESIVESPTYNWRDFEKDPYLVSIAYKYSGVDCSKDEDFYIHPSTCTLYEQVNTDASFGIPYNSYLSLRPRQADDNQIEVCIFLRHVLLPLPYEVELVFAPDVVEHTDTLPSLVNISMGYPRKGDEDFSHITLKAEMVNPQNGSKNFAIANSGKYVSVKFDWTPDYMLRDVFLKVNSNVNPMLQGKSIQKDFRLSKISLRLKDAK